MSPINQFSNHVLQSSASLKVYGYIRPLLATQGHQKGHRLSANQYQAKRVICSHLTTTKHFVSFSVNEY